MGYKQLNDIIKDSKNILIMSHLNPDGDTLGSMLGLYSAIKDNFKKKPDMLVMSEIPFIYKFLPNSNEAKIITDFDNSREYDLVINVDIASHDRMFDASIFFEKASFTVNIDHHKTNSGYAELNFIEPSSSSTGEVLFGLMNKMGWKISLDTATCLYTAILTDTGGFRFDNTSSKTFQVASKLVELGVQPSVIHKNCYENNSKEMVLFQAYCLSKAKFVNDNKIAYIIIYKKDFEKFGAKEDCTEGLIERLKAVSGIEVAFMVKQLGNKISKISMRSQKTDVAKICSNFGGGGHTLAAGCVIKANPENSADMIIEAIKEL